MSFVINPTTGKLDVRGLTKKLAQTLFLMLDGSNGPMTGALQMGQNAIILQDSDENYWALTVNTDGALVTEEYSQTAPWDSIATTWDSTSINWDQT